MSRGTICAVPTAKHQPAPAAGKEPRGGPNPKPSAGSAPGPLAQAFALNGLVQRKCACGGGSCPRCSGSGKRGTYFGGMLLAQPKCGGCGADKPCACEAPLAQPKAEGADSGTSAAALVPAGGSPLPQALRARFEPTFGRTFEDVRVHSGPEAARVARAQSAQAFTVGRDIVFGEGHYAPGSPRGDALLAHELAHVVQQGGRRHTATDASPALEHEADAAADRAMAGRFVGELTPVAPGVQRKPVDADNPPRTNLWATVEGLNFRPLEPAEWRAGEIGPQFYEIIVFRLAGPKRYTKELARAAWQEVQANQSQLSKKKRIAKGDGKETVQVLSVDLRIALLLLEFLREGGGKVDIDPETEAVLQIGRGALLMYLGHSFGEVLPKWYSERIFR